MIDRKNGSIRRRHALSVRSAFRSPRSRKEHGAETFGPAPNRDPTSPHGKACFLAQNESVSADARSSVRGLRQPGRAVRSERRTRSQDFDAATPTLDGARGADRAERQAKRPPADSRWSWNRRAPDDRSGVRTIVRDAASCCFYRGIFGGNALARVLLGADSCIALPSKSRLAELTIAPDQLLAQGDPMTDHRRHSPRVVRRMLLVSLLPFACALGCSSKTAETTGSADAACAAYASAYRSWSQRCAPGTPVLSEPEWARYEARSAATCRSIVALDGTSVSAADVSRCADGIRSVKCGEEADCKMPPGKLSAGAACLESVQCQSSRCSKSGSSACGTCIDAVALGGACTPGGASPCQGEAHCEPGVTPGTGTCVAITRSGVGGPCGTGVTACAADLFCDSGTCRPKLAPGAACSSMTSCAGGVCDSSGTKTCIAFGGAEGRPCGAMRTCDVGLTCDSVAGTCVKTTPVDPGQSCAATSARCKHGSCNPSTKLCPMLLADADTCAADGSLGICDFYAECVAGKCTPSGQTICK